MSLIALAFLAQGTAQAAVTAKTASVQARHIDAQLHATSFAGPLGWVRFCERAPAHCINDKPRRSGPVHLALTPALERQLRAVQRETNAAITPVNEPQGWDAWLIAPALGDCEDFALTKRAALIALGVPSQALRLATVLTEAHEHHVVLLVETDAGTLALDNRHDDVVAYQELPYRWLSVQDPTDPRRWQLSQWVTEVDVAWLRAVLSSAAGLAVEPDTAPDAPGFGRN